MLACGTECQPTRILREIQLFASSTRPARVSTDVGDGFVKGMGNPQGDGVLTAELVAAELGRWFGLAIPPFAIVPECEITIPMSGHHLNMSPPLFFSKAVDGIPRDGSDVFLKLLAKPSDISRLIVFDTWIRNKDRYVEGSENSDNLLYVRSARRGKFELVPIDHTHAFIEVDFETELPGEDLIADETVYGNFPEFAPFITAESVSDAIEDLRALDPLFVGQCVNAVPRQWGLSQIQRGQLVELICERAKYVVESLPAKLVAAPILPWVGGRK